MSHHHRSALPGALACGALLALAPPALVTAGPTATASGTLPAPPGSTPVDSASPDGGDEWRRRWREHVRHAQPDSYAGGAPTAELAAGNRVLVIGDSIVASTATRYGGETCAELVPSGWAVEVDAETGRFVEFGVEVVEARLDGGFDAGVVMLGNNYRGDAAAYEDELRTIVEALAPRPTVLLTVTLYRPNRAEVNEAIYEVAMDHDNVRVIDWAHETADDPDLLAGDGLHLNDAGRLRLAQLVAGELGDAPASGGDRVDGRCLASRFTDDSATSGTGTTIPGQAPPPPEHTSSPPAAGDATPQPAATSAAGGGGAPRPTSPAPANPPATNPPATNPPATNPPPPPTNPPVTNAPPPPPPPTNPPVAAGFAPAGAPLEAARVHPGGG